LTFSDGTHHIEVRCVLFRMTGCNDALGGQDRPGSQHTFFSFCSLSDAPSKINQARTVEEAKAIAKRQFAKRERRDLFSRGGGLGSASLALSSVAAGKLKVA